MRKRNKNLKESFKEIERKTINVWGDGKDDELVMYKDDEKGTYVIMLGDDEPSTTYAEYVSDDERDAYEAFDSYEDDYAINYATWESDYDDRSHNDNGSSNNKKTGYFTWADYDDDDYKDTNYKDWYSSYYKRKEEDEAVKELPVTSDTLVIHPDDRTTDMLKVIYEGRGWDVINGIGINAATVRDQIEKHDRIIMLGHGTPSGLINSPTFGYIINDSLADLLRTKKTFSVWCHSNEYFERNNIRDNSLHTGMIISEVSEERWVLGYAPLDEFEMAENMDLFSDAVKGAVDLEGEAIKDYILNKYVGDDPVTQYNRERIIIL